MNRGLNLMANPQKKSKKAASEKGNRGVQVRDLPPPKVNAVKGGEKAEAGSENIRRVN
jgi:hypothetical protein